jgi:hypothetical protein
MEEVVSSWFCANKIDAKRVAKRSNTIEGRCLVAILQRIIKKGKLSYSYQKVGYIVDLISIICCSTIVQHFFYKE